MVFIPIAEYRPDVASVNTNYTDTLENVLPSESSYIPVPSVNFFSPALDDVVLGAHCLRSGATVKIIVGGEKGLYLFDSHGRVFKNISKPGVEYHADLDNPWSFTVFGHYLIAVNPKDKPQCFDLKTGTTFDDLGGNPPKARFVKVWGDFLCLLHLENNPSRVHWSGLNDITHWTVGEKSCDYQDFADGEFVQGSTEATNPIIFMRSAIYAAMFVPGSKLVFSFNKIQDKRGAKSAAGIACRGDYAFFIDDGGFYQIAFDGGVIPIGFEKVDRTLFNKFDNEVIGDIQGVVDPVHNRVYWRFRVSELDQTTLVYDWGLGKWSTLRTPPLFLFPAYTTGYTLDQLDEVSTDLDELPASLDSRLWQSGAPVLACIDMNGRLGMFTGRNMEATVVSQEIGEPGGSVVFFEKAFVQIDTLDAQLIVGSRMLRSSDMLIKWHKPRSCSQITGAYHCRSRSRFHRLKVRIPYGVVWRHISGFSVDVQVSGSR